MTRVARPSEHPTVLAMFREHARPGDALARFSATIMRHDQGFRPEHLQVVEVDGRLDGVVLLVDRTMRVGSATVRCALMLLAVAQQSSGQDLASVLLRNALGWARVLGYHLAMLWGSTALYPRFGFAPVLKSYRVILPAGLKPVDTAGYVVRPVARSDTPALAACYHQSTALTTLAELRTDAPWQWRLADDRQFVEVVVDPLGAVRGYFRASRGDGRLDVVEVAASDDGAAPALSNRLLELAAGGTVHVRATPDNRWSRWAFEHGASFLVTGGRQATIRVLDLARWFDAIRPELQRRVERSEYVCRESSLRLETPMGSLTLRIERGSIAFDQRHDAALVTMPSTVFGSLAVGYRSVESLIGEPGVQIEGEQTLRLLDLLFPEGCPHWSSPAYF